MILTKTLMNNIPKYRLTTGIGSVLVKIPAPKVQVFNAKKSQLRRNSKRRKK
ncbi:hypothetical protein D1BOALGB6SA_838 [Olavius sp. associated proteobacterium Delta 1]|nr:hypothetical protein D1BOALGB6SA_838 [Olavius sp. associated proteobacterium Delta 1]